jgi:hypothetical protein
MILKSDSISPAHSDQCDSAAGTGIGDIDRHFVQSCNAATSARPSRCRARGGYPLPDKQWNASPYRARDDDGVPAIGALTDTLIPAGRSAAGERVGDVASKGRAGAVSELPEANKARHQRGRLIPDLQFDDTEMGCAVRGRHLFVMRGLALLWHAGLNLRGRARRSSLAHHGSPGSRIM